MGHVCSRLAVPQRRRARRRHTFEPLGTAPLRPAPGVIHSQGSAAGRYHLLRFSQDSIALYAPGCDMAAPHQTFPLLYGTLDDGRYEPTVLTASSTRTLISTQLLQDGKVAKIMNIRSFPSLSREEKDVILKYTASRLSVGAAENILVVDDTSIGALDRYCLASTLLSRGECKDAKIAFERLETLTPHSLGSYVAVVVCMSSITCSQVLDGHVVSVNDTRPHTAMLLERIQPLMGRKLRLQHYIAMINDGNTIVLNHIAEVVKEVFADYLKQHYFHYGVEGQRLTVLVASEIASMRKSVVMGVEAAGHLHSYSVDVGELPWAQCHAKAKLNYHTHNTVNNHGRPSSLFGLA